MPETWFKISRYSNEITSLEVLRRTAKTLYVKHGLRSRVCQERLDGTQFDTLKGAQEAVTLRAERAVENARRQLSRSENQLKAWRDSL